MTQPPNTTPPGTPQGYVPPRQSVPPTYAGIPAYPAGGPARPPYPVLAPPPVAPNGQPLASFADRLLAWMIDTALATAVAVVLFVPVFIWLFQRMFSEMDRLDAGTEPDPTRFMGEFLLPMLIAEFAVFAVLLGFYWLYHVEYAHRTGQTLGKKAMKIRIVPLDPAQTLTRGMAGKRYLIEFVAASLVPFLNYLDGFWQLWDKPWQQCLHDKFAGTVVVKVAP
ncbi:RDD family protein [Micromonospora sp. R77]|uniref:RDD family protein n=1 Tax=Micromonospora sp. R77 TaxID=2925836 RepID=UPI001F616239|nr:RDD family protein [Micromonospora sp. R77]MCI4063076.1 RDD family protein [Micromonospora sp. R77]